MDLLGSTGSWSELEFIIFKYLIHIGRDRKCFSLSKMHLIQFSRCLVPHEDNLRYNLFLFKNLPLIDRNRKWFYFSKWHFIQFWRCLVQYAVGDEIWSCLSFFSILTETGSGSLFVSCILFNFWDVWSSGSWYETKLGQFQVFTKYWQRQEVAIS